jgi:putative ABC transport system permease protein
MIRNYFIIAIRNFWRNKIFSLINISGLAIGISASLVIYLIVNYDFSFDKFQEGNDRIYRVVSNFSFAGGYFRNSGVPYPAGQAVRNEITGLELVTFFRTWQDNVKIGIPDPKKDRPLLFRDQKDIVFADESYFKLIPHKWIIGGAAISLKQPYQVVLTETNARLYFPGLPLAAIPGKEIIFNDTVPMIVTGIVEDLKEHTDFTFKTFISRLSFEKTSLMARNADRWDNTNSATQLFIKLIPGTSKEKTLVQLNQLLKKYEKKEPEDHSTSEFGLQPLSDVHFNSNYDNFDQRLAHKPTLYGLLAVAAFLLLLGCINFINLKTAHASQRAREIGIRKTMGSSKRSLVLQFLSETFFLTLIATVLSVLIAPLLLKAFADFIPDGLHFNLWRTDLVIFLMLLVLVVSVFSGFYPALVLSSFKPVTVLKNQTSAKGAGTRKALFRKTLTVTQFVIAQIFIIATILVSKQIRFSLNKDLGFRKDAIVYFYTNFYDTVKTHKDVLMEKFRTIPEIAMVSLSNNPPSSSSIWTSTLKYKDGKKEVELSAEVKTADTNYIKLYNLKLVAGNNFMASDTMNAILVNESFVRACGFANPHEALGKYIDWHNTLTPIAGVIADFHQKSMHEEIKPLVITNARDRSGLFNILLRPQNAEGTVWKTAIGKIEKAWKEIYPEDELKIEFLDQSVAKYYESEKKISGLLLWATGLSIFISLLGLLGLTMYITNQRTKEIGIRKVVGATVLQIISLLSKDFLKLVVIAIIIAIPLAWWASFKWLQNFAYKTKLDWWVFLAGGLITILLALVILVLRTFRAAAANPVKSLRTE